MPHSVKPPRFNLLKLDQHSPESIHVVLQLLQVAVVDKQHALTGESSIVLRAQAVPCVVFKGGSLLER